MSNVREMTPFSEVYKRFKVLYYKDVFKRLKSSKIPLSTEELYCLEIIEALEEPTINEFAGFVGISSPNATYKINALIQKGYVEKIQSSTDKREYMLRITDKYYKDLSVSEKYFDIVEEKLKASFTEEEYEEFNRLFRKISVEVLPMKKTDVQ